MIERQSHATQPCDKAMRRNREITIPSTNNSSCLPLNVIKEFDNFICHITFMIMNMVFIVIPIPLSTMSISHSARHQHHHHKEDKCKFHNGVQHIDDDNVPLTS